MSYSQVNAAAPRMVSTQATPRLRRACLTAKSKRLRRAWFRPKLPRGCAAMLPMGQETHAEAMFYSTKLRHVSVRGLQACSLHSLNKKSSTRIVPNSQKQVSVCKGVRKVVLASLGNHPFKILLGPMVFEGQFFLALFCGSLRVLRSKTEKTSGDCHRRNQTTERGMPHASDLAHFFRVLLCRLDEVVQGCEAVLGFIYRGVG